MNRTLTLTSAIVVAALGLATLPADAQDRRSAGQQRGGGRAEAARPAQREGGRQAVPRSSEGRQYSAPQTMPRSSEGRQYSAPQAMPRSSQGGQYSAPQTMPRSSQGRQYSAPQAMPRGYDNRQLQQRAVPRTPDRRGFGSPSYRYDDRRGYAQPRGGYGQSYYRGFNARPYVRPYNFTPYRPYSFSRSYYSFRPRLNIGLSLLLGFPVPYPWSYLRDYRPRVYGYYSNDYYSNGYYNAVPGVQTYQSYGGLSFDIEPSDADLFIDGEYVGTVGTFTPYGEPLTLMPGQHRVTIQREGFQTMEWDVTIEPGQVLPYRGAMERY